jgi:hypothetical protein
MDPRRLKIAAVAVAALAAASAAGTGDEELSVTGAGRIALSLDGRGYLREIEAGRQRLGMRWPGPEGTEFLGSGGFLIRFRAGENGTLFLLGPGDFEPVMPGGRLAQAREGCRGGRRYPAEGCDDDGDGTADEDPLDWRDNDGDGMVDEDFAAVGDRMCVTSVRERRFGITVTTRHHFWNYGHVRDFIGFSTRMEYHSPSGVETVLREFELIQYIDFEIGDRDDADRGRDDCAFLLQLLPEEGEKAGHPVAGAAEMKGRGPMAALVILSASSPDGPLTAEAEVRGGQEPVDSLWSGGKEVFRVLGGEPSPPDMEVAELVEAVGGGELALEEKAPGNVSILHRFGPRRDIRTGETIELEWAIVFGKDHATLMRNISRARETWEGLSLAGGAVVRWVVPARKAVRVSVDAALAPVWVQGEKRPSVTVGLPAVEGEEIEWLRVAGERAEDFETVGGRIVIALDEKTASSGPFYVEGQLTDGTIFNSYIGAEELQRFAGADELQPGRLPEDSVRLFPNPFVSELTIDIRVHEPSKESQEKYHAAQPGISSVRVYDVKGRLVRTVLADEVLHPGEHSLGWNGTDEAGTKVAPGVYYCRLQIGERSLTRRVILLK